MSNVGSQTGLRGKGGDPPAVSSVHTLPAAAEESGHVVCGVMAELRKSQNRWVEERGWWVEGVVLCACAPSGPSFSLGVFHPPTGSSVVAS